jgi:hypothetical protein
MELSIDWLLPECVLTYTLHAIVVVEEEDPKRITHHPRIHIKPKRKPPTANNNTALASF